MSEPVPEVPEPPRWPWAPEGYVPHDSPERRELERLLAACEQELAFVRVWLEGSCQCSSCRWRRRRRILRGRRRP